MLLKRQLLSGEVDEEGRTTSVLGSCYEKISPIFHLSGAIDKKNREDALRNQVAVTTRAIDIHMKAGVSVNCYAMSTCIFGMHCRLW